MKITGPFGLIHLGNDDSEDWEFLRNLGDATPVIYGGYFIYKNGQQYLAEYWRGAETERNRNHIYRFDIEDDALDDLNWIKESDLVSLASFVGSTPEALKTQAESKDIYDRANFYRNVGEYFGFDNLDSYPEVLSEAELGDWVRKSTKKRS